MPYMEIGTEGRNRDEQTQRGAPTAPQRHKHSGFRTLLSSAAQTRAARRCEGPQGLGRGKRACEAGEDGREHEQYELGLRADPQAARRRQGDEDCGRQGAIS